MCLLASGGHTLLLDVQDRGGFGVLGTTLDDAAGEAFDKGARLLGLGYPGGAAIDRLAQQGDPEAYAFPVARVPGLDFSFSGVKTALLYAVRDLEPAELEERRADLAASYQRAIVRALVERVEQTGAERVAVVGGRGRQLRAAERTRRRRVRAARPLHGQRGHDRLGGAVPGGPGGTRLPFRRCVRVRGLTERRLRSRSSWSSPSRPPSSLR